MAKTQCDRDRTVPVYSNQTRQVSKTREVPVYDTRQVRKTRQRYRTEPVYQTWYVWQQGEWLNERTLTAQSQNFTLQYPDTSSLENKPNFKIGTPKKTCNIEVKADSRQLPVQNMKIDCSLYEKLSANDGATVSYRKWGGIKEIKIRE